MAAVVGGLSNYPKNVSSRESAPHERQLVFQTKDADFI